MENINIAFCFDKNLMYHSLITVASLLTAAKKEDIHYNIYCIVQSGAEKIQNKMQNIVKRFDIASNVNFIKADDEFKGAYETRGITSASYLRLKLDKLLPDIDKIIYSDIDVLFQGGGGKQNLA